jgi:hypothetical protein
VTNDLHVALALSGFDGTIASFTDVTADYPSETNSTCKLTVLRL